MPFEGIYAVKKLEIPVHLATVLCWAKFLGRMGCHHCSSRISFAGHGKQTEKKGEAVSVVL